MQTCSTGWLRGATLAMVLLWPFGDVQAGSTWDVAALDVQVSRLVEDGQSYHFVSTSTITVGDMIRIECHYKYLALAEPKAMKKWSITFDIGNEWLDAAWNGASPSPDPDHVEVVLIYLHIKENLVVSLAEDPNSKLGQLEVGKQVVTCQLDRHDNPEEWPNDNNKATWVVDVRKSAASPSRAAHIDTLAPVFTPPLAFIGAYPVLSSEQGQGPAAAAKAAASLPAVRSSSILTQTSNGNRAAAKGAATSSASASAGASTGVLEFEAEDALQSGRLAAQNGQVALQSMTSFSGNWSHNAHVLLRPDAAVRGAAAAGLPAMTLQFDVAQAASYAFEAYLTRAPNYGELEIAVDGKPSGVKFLGYSPKVIGANPVQVGKFSLSAGQHVITFKVISKHNNSSGYLAGLDRIRLYWAGPP